VVLEWDLKCGAFGGSGLCKSDRGGHDEVFLVRKTLIELCLSVRSTVCHGRDGQGQSRKMVFWPEVHFIGDVTGVVMTV
jgi:hypothetical protein